MTVSVGPASVVPEHDQDTVLDTSFRVLLDYNVGTDAHMVRLDWLRLGTQVNAVFHARRTYNAHLGKIGNGRDELVMPKHLAGFAVQVSSKDVIGALRGMADRLEQELKSS